MASYPYDNSPNARKLKSSIFSIFISGGQRMLIQMGKLRKIERECVTVNGINGVPWRLKIQPRNPRLKVARDLRVSRAIKVQPHSLARIISCVEFAHIPYTYIIVLYTSPSTATSRVRCAAFKFKLPFMDAARKSARISYMYRDRVYVCV